MQRAGVSSDEEDEVAEDDQATERRGVDWKRIADGLMLVGIGVFLMLAARGDLPRGFWADAVSFWPVFLISAGITVAFEKTRHAWLLLLGPAAVLGTVFWLAFGEPPPLPAPGEWRPLGVAREEAVGEVLVQAGFAGVRLDLEAASLEPGLLASGRAASRAGEPTISVHEADSGRVRLELEGAHTSGFMIIGRRRETWELAVTDSVPLAFELNGVFINGPLSLERARLARGEVTGVFNVVDVYLPAPRETVPLRVAGVFNTCTITVPEGVPVRVRGSGFPFNLLDRGAERTWAPGRPGYEISLDGVFSHLEVVDGPAREAPLPLPSPSPEDGADGAGDAAAVPEAGLSEGPSPEPPASP